MLLECFSSLLDMNRNCTGYFVLFIDILIVFTICIRHCLSVCQLNKSGVLRKAIEYIKYLKNSNKRLKHDNILLNLKLKFNFTGQHAAGSSELMRTLYLSVCLYKVSLSSCLLVTWIQMFRYLG